MAASEQDQRVLAKKVDAVGWGLFFIWIGVAFLLDVPWGVGLLGVGIIALGSQAARKYFGLAVEAFGLAFGIVFVVWGLWELLRIGAVIPGGLLPLMFVAVGALLVASAFVHRPHH